MLPWKLASLLLMLVAALTGWTVSWDPFSERRPGAGAPFPRATRKGDGPAVLFVGNSRLEQVLRYPPHAREMLDDAGWGDHEALLIGGPSMNVLSLERKREMLEPLRPTVLVVEVDLLLPGGRRAQAPDPIERLRHMETDGQTLARAVRIFSVFERCRRLAVEVPFSESVIATLGPAWQADRRAGYARVRAAGFELLGDGEPWPDALFTDGRHLAPAGAARFRAWLAAELRALPEPG